MAQYEPCITPFGKSETQRVKERRGEGERENIHVLHIFNKGRTPYVRKDSYA